MDSTSQHSSPDADSYSSDYYARAYNLDGPRLWEVNWWSVRFYAALIRREMRQREMRRFLEIGCGLGFVLQRLEQEFETAGVDISPFAIEKARELAPRSTVAVADITEQIPEEIASGGYDFILAKYVLEHLVDPKAALDAIASLLAPNGLLLYAVPNMESPGRRMKGDSWYAYHDETHVSLLDPDEWLERTQRAGFTIVGEYSDGLWDVPYVRYIPRLAQYPIFSLPTIASVLTTRPFLKRRGGENIIVLAQKS